MIEIRNLICEYPDGAGRIRALDLPYARLTNAPWALIGPREREIDAFPCGERPAHADIGRDRGRWEGRRKAEGEREM